MKKILELKEWSLRKDPTGQLPATLSDHNFPVPATVPGCVHTDLLNAGLIPDPFFADNEVKLEWIHLNNWIYSTEFNLLPDFNPQEPIYLIFEGLDTLADISLNGKRVASTHNMFREYSFRVDHLLRGDSNQITIKFTSPVRGAQSLEKRHGKLAVSLNSERVYLRKAQYSFGWDWGPSFPTMGIWKPAYLMQRGSSRISSLQFFTSDLKRSYARVNLQLILDGKIRRSQLFAELKDPQGKIIASGKSKAQKTVDFDWIIENPVLWWPNGEGEQNLHTLTVCLLDATGGETDCLEKRVGIRTIQLQTENKSKNIFRFLINNQPVYIKGSNWIPADSFLPRISPRKYRSLLQMAADAHMNMVRIWGGGIYEQDIFYDICDELGLLVWQDFMFACGSYPVLPEFLENVKAEVEQVVRRFQYHPCIALWCGNNENEWIWYHTQPGPLTNMYDYRIYHKLLPALVKKLDPGCPYWPSSPFGFDRDPNSPTSGNRHEWDIWSSWVDYEKVKSDHSLFVTEFGFQGPANFHTLEKVIPPDHRKTCDPLFDFHNKQIEGNERLFRFLSGHFPVHSNWWDFIYLTQLNQGMALKTCLEQWRFYSAVTSGSIIWQLNDCWPVISWSLIDSQVSPKLAYYMVKSVFSQQVVYFQEEKESLMVVVRNEYGDLSRQRIRVDAINRINGKSHIVKEGKPVRISGRINELFGLSLDLVDKFRESILIATLLDGPENIRSRNFFVKIPWKYCILPPPSIIIKPAGKSRLEISADVPALFVDLYHPDILFNDRAIIVLPGEKRFISYNRIRGKKPFLENIRIFCLNHYISGNINPRSHSITNI